VSSISVVVQLVCGLPVLVVDGRVPGHHHFSRHGQVSTANTDEWWEILPRQKA
jgi:hypothetical protein